MGERGIVRRAFKVTGRVQGVGFRWWTRHAAARFGLGGWVRNEGDGSVVVHVMGPGDSVARFAEELWKGPPGARVDGRVDIEPNGELDGEVFRIER